MLNDTSIKLIVSLFFLWVTFYMAINLIKF